MKNLFYIFMLMNIVSCASIDTNRIAPGYTAAYKAIKLSILGYENEIEPNLISNIPYASMLVRIGKGPTALMILEREKNEEYTWVSADGVYLVIKNGKIIKTGGLPNNINDRLDPVLEWEDIYSQNLQYASYVSFTSPTLNNLKVTSSYHEKGYSDQNLLFGYKKLKLVEEIIESHKIAWYETNQYWLDDNNFTWKSVQFISPKLPPVYFEVTKKPK